MTLRDLADLSGVDYTTISRIERQITDPSARTVKALTNALGHAISERGAK